MIVCLCTGAAERDIHSAIDRGARTLRDLQACGIGNGCGCCHPMIHTMLAARAAAAEALCGEEAILASFPPRSRLTAQSRPAT